jgi:hypothetical protein
MWLRCPQAHQGEETAHPRGYAGYSHFHLRDPCRYARYQGSSLFARRTQVLRTPPLQRSGRIVPTAGRSWPPGVRQQASGSWKEWNAPQAPVAEAGGPRRMGRRTPMQLDCSQPEHEQGRRAKGPDQRNAHRGGDDPAAGHSFGVQERTSSQTLHYETITLPLTIEP